MTINTTVHCFARKRGRIKRLKPQEAATIHEVFRGQTVRQGEIEVFDLNGHKKAKRAYGWSHGEGTNDEGERFVTVLETPPVESAIAVVRVSIVADGKSDARRRKIDLKKNSN